MNTDEQLAAARAERAAEHRRRLAAAVACAACVIGAAFMLLVMVRFPGHLSDTVLRVLVALVLAVAMVLGARALDGPIRMRENRRGLGSYSEAAAALMLWLGCFATIMTAFVVSDLLARVGLPGGGAGLGSSMSLSQKSSPDGGTLKVVVNNGSGAVDRGTGAGSAVDASPRGGGGSSGVSGR